MCGILCAVRLHIVHTLAIVPPHAYTSQSSIAVTHCILIAINLPTPGARNCMAVSSAVSEIQQFDCAGGNFTPYGTNYRVNTYYADIVYNFRPARL